MDAAGESAALLARLRDAGDPARAISEAAYLKIVDLPFAGVRVPECRRLTRAFLAAHPDLDRSDLLALTCELWAAPLFEAKRVAVELLSQRPQLLEAADISLVEELVRTSYTWALVDELAVVVAGDLVVRFDSCAEVLDRWAADDDFWVRRSALLALYRPVKGGGEVERFFRYADAMLDEREFFIRKAIGWVLRDLAKRRPAIVRDWLLPRAARASGVTVREAVKWLPAEGAEAIRRAHRPVR
jgi:3-methyladenine DNA glycosylase AlkD